MATLTERATSAWTQHLVAVEAEWAQAVKSRGALELKRVIEATAPSLVPKGRVATVDIDGVRLRVQAVPGSEDPKTAPFEVVVWCQGGRWCKIGSLAQLGRLAATREVEPV